MTTDVIEAFAGAVADEVAKRVGQDTLPDRLLDRKGLAAYIGVTTRHIDAGVRKGFIPAPTYYGPRCPRWSLSDVQAWHESHKE